MRRPTVFWVFPAPDPDGDTVKQAAYYLLWWPVYRTIRTVRHRFGIHDWDPSMGGRWWCHWCGATRQGSHT